MEITMSPTIGAIAAALAKAQGEMKLPEKNRTVTVQTKTGGKYTFEYADLAAIHAVIREPLSKNSLAYTHLIGHDEKGPCLRTMLIHSSGEWFSSRYPLPSTADPKDLGGQVTYGKRYSICALIGCVADDDNDAEPAQVVQQPQARPARPQLAVEGGKAMPAPTPSVLAPAGAQPDRVTQVQLANLFGLIRRSGWSEEEFRGYLKETTGLASTREMNPAQYEQAVRDLGTLPPHRTAPGLPVQAPQQSVNRSEDNNKPIESPADIAKRIGEKQIAEKNAKTRPRQTEPEIEGEFAGFRS